MIGHAAAAGAIGAAAAPPRAGARAWTLGIAVALAPDLDAIGFRLGIPYSAPFGHRGATHSILFAAIFAGAAALAAGSPTRDRNRVLLWLFLAAVSHGLLDAATNGGLGVAFLWPISNRRFFFPFRPIAVSPIGIVAFLGRRGVHVLASEALWIGVPSLALAFAALGARRARREARRARREERRAHRV